MGYKTEQGRYARMASFWAIFLLLAYGCLDGVDSTVRGWVGDEPWMDPLPLIGEIDTGKVVSLAVLALGGLLIHRFLNRPKVADLLIDTESELKKVTWPTANETTVGSIAVVITVLVMLVFLFGSDLVLSYLVKSTLKG